MNFFYRAALTLFLAALPALAQAVPVTLRVVGETGAPIKDAQVSYYDAAQNENAQTLVAQTAADGTVALDLRGESRAGTNVDGARYVLLDPELGGARVQVPGYGARYLRLAPGENVVALSRPALVRGEVRDGAGAPVAGARVQLEGVEKDENAYADQLVRGRLKLEPTFALTQKKRLLADRRFAAGLRQFPGQRAQFRHRPKRVLDSKRR